MNIQYIKSGKYIGLVVDGIPQSIYPPPPDAYYTDLVPETNPKTVLVLGAGAGTVCRLLLDKFPNVQITGVENNKEIIKAAKEKLKFDEIKMKLVMDDAFKWIYKDQNKYGLIIVDIFNGPWVTSDVLSMDFITQCKRLLENGGSIRVNLPDFDTLAAKQFPGSTKTMIGGCCVYKWEDK